MNITMIKDEKGRFIKGLHYNPKNEFKKGDIPWNKGKYGYMGANITSFTKESIKRNDFKTPSKRKRDGFYMSLEDEFVPTKSYNGKVYNHHKRISMGRWVLKQNGITVPKNYVVYHKDGDVLNNDISNLEVISRAELLHRNQRS